MASMPYVTDADIARMRDQLFFEGPERSRRLSRFWVLLLLAAVIASAGVVSDSTATVIGAMIVAPLMTPILGTMLAVVLADRANLGRSILLVMSGAIAVIGIGWLLGQVVSYPIVAATNSQVAARISPRLMDMVAALATGAVGSVALARPDISDTLPGVAIAISLVPPLAVVGLTLESGKIDQALGALLLFVTNVTAILASGIVVMALYRVYARAPRPGAEVRYFRRSGAIVAIATLLVVVAVPLAYTSRRVSNARRVQAQVGTVADTWAKAAGWSVTDVSHSSSEVLVRVTGPTPEPSTSDLRAALDAGGLRSTSVHVELVPADSVDLAGH
ncbi:MAG: DUF389 domain-containing protein [Acidimicrobiales bacterium]